MTYNNVSYNDVLDRLNRKKRNLSTIFKNFDDRFSSLPEDILTRILSLLLIKYAVRTSILSKSWRYRWALVTNLDFDDTDHIGLYSFTSFVDRALKLCKTSQVKLFRLHSSDKLVPESSVTKWINEAVRLNVLELDIQVKRMELPLSLLTCKTLTKLRLDSSNEGIYYMREEFPCQVNLPCMKILDMSFYNNPFVNAFKLINGCPMLESLSWKVRRFHDDIEDYTFNIPSLKRLELALRNATCSKVVLHVPNLEYLSVGGTLTSVYVMKDVSSLVEASISFREIRSHHDPDLLWAKLLKGLRGVKSLLFQNISSAFRLPYFPNMARLKLTSSWNSAAIFQFLERSPELKHLYIEKLQESHWIEPKLVPTCMLTSLTTIEFSISKWWKCDTRFLEYMLGNAEVLETVTIIAAYSSNIKEEKLLCAELLKFPRACSCCEMHFHGN